MLFGFCLVACLGVAGMLRVVGVVGSNSLGVCGMVGIKPFCSALQCRS